MISRIRSMMAYAKVTAQLAWLAFQGMVDNIRNPLREEVEFGHVKVAGPQPNLEEVKGVDPNVVADLRERGVKDPQRAAAAWARIQGTSQSAPERTVTMSRLGSRQNYDATWPREGDDK